MPLNESCRELIGRKLVVLPYYGHGWTRVDNVTPSETDMDALGPEPFALRLDEVIYCNQEIMGLSGVVDKPNEIFDGYSCCCLLRSTDSHDLKAHCGEYIVWISKRKLEVFPEPYPKKALGDWIVKDETAFCWGGYGTIAESVEWVRDLYERVVKGREQAKKQCMSRSFQNRNII